MDDPIKEQQPSSAVTASNGKSKLRYPLRSSTTKLKADISPTANSISAHKRVRASSSVSLASLSANEKSAKPPRRLSIPTKRTVSPRPKPSTKNTPISEARVRGSLTSQPKSDTPASDVSKSSTHRKFNVLSSASYWLSQIKLSESVPNHALSLGFFKLALEAGCEPLQRLRDELKSYVLKYNTIKLQETVIELFGIYGISETMEQMQVSESCFHEPEEGTLSSIELTQGSNSPVGAGKLKFTKSLKSEAPKVSSGKESFVKMNASKTSATCQLQGTVNRKSDTRKLVEENGTWNTKRKTVNTNNQLPRSGQDNIKEENRSEGEAPSKPLETEVVVYDNKENMDAAAVDEIRVT